MNRKGLNARSLRGKDPMEGNLLGAKLEQEGKNMLMTTIMFAAAGYSLIYLLLGGGIGGAVLIFFVAKMLGK